MGVSMDIRKCAVILLVLLMLTCTACSNRKKVTGIELDKAQLELDDYCSTIPGYVSDGERIYFDVTKDKNLDLCTTVTIGREWKHTAVIVYDVVNATFYLFEDDSVNYSISGIEKNKLIIKEGEDTRGTIKFVFGKLRFFPMKK